MSKRLIFYLSLIFAVMMCSCGALEDSDDEYESREDKKGEGTLFGFGEKKDTDEEKKLSQFERMFKDAPKLAWDDNKLAGYIDINGEWLIQPAYSKAKAFSEGLAPVQDADTGLWGYIDLDGEYVFEPQYYDAYKFTDGNAVVATDDYHCYGLMNRDGEFIIDPVNREVSNFKEGYALVRREYESSCRFYDETGTPVFDEYEKAYLFNDGIAVVKEYGDYGTSGEWKILHQDGSFTEFNVILDEEAFTSHSVYGDSNLSGYIDFRDGYAVKSIYKDYVMVDNEGNTFGEYFHYLSGFYGDYACAGKKDENGRLLKGFINKDFEWVIEPQYWEEGFIDIGYAYAVEEEMFSDPYGVEYHWYIIDMAGNRIADFEQHDGINFAITDGIYRIKPGDDSLPVPAVKHFSEEITDIKYGFSDWEYNEVIPFIYDGVDGFSSDGSYSIVKYEGHYGMIDINGEWLIEPKFNSFTTYPQ